MYNKKKCIICNKIFYKKRNESIKYFKTKRTCSNKCRFEDIKGIGRFCGGYNKICRYCKKSFFTYDKNKKFCKKKCYHKWLNGRDRCGNLIIRKKCLCGCKKFLSENKRKFYSFRCLSKYIIKRRPKRKCKYCNKSLNVSNYNKDIKKFCKKKCYIKWQKNRNKDGKLLKNKKCKYCDKKIPYNRNYCKFEHYNKYRLCRFPHTDKKIILKKCKCGCKRIVRKHQHKFYNMKCFCNYRKNKSYNKFYGIKKSKSIRNKQSKGNKGKLKGTEHSKEYNKNVSKGVKKLWKNPKFRRKHILSMKNPIVIKKMKNARLKQIFPKKDTSIEVIIQKELKRRKVKFKKHIPIIGQPDIFIKPNICVFCDGDYWHSYPFGTSRDKEVNNSLKNKGYKVLRFWERYIKLNIIGCVDKIEGVMLCFEN